MRERSRRARADGAVATLALFPSLGTTAAIWDRVVRLIASPVDVVAVDLPGHGGARACADVSMPALVGAARADLADIDDEIPLVVAGVSLGGAIGLELAASDPRVAAVVTVCSALRFGTPSGWYGIETAVLEAGTAAHDPDGTRAGWFTRAFDDQATVRSTLRTLDEVDVPSYLACCRLLTDYDGSPAVDRLQVPGFAVGAHDDRATPADGMRELAERAGTLAFVTVPGAHLAVVESPAHVAAVLDRAIHLAITPASHHRGDPSS